MGVAKVCYRFTAAGRQRDSEQPLHEAVQFLAMPSPERRGLLSQGSRHSIFGGADHSTSLIRMASVQ